MNDVNPKLVEVVLEAAKSSPPVDEERATGFVANVKIGIVVVEMVVTKPAAVIVVPY